MEGSTDYTIACTATGFEIISVGAYVSKENIRIFRTVHLIGLNYLIRL